MRFVRANSFELLVAFLVFTNLFPAWFPQITYYLAFPLLWWKMMRMGPASYGKTLLFYVFLVYLWVSTAINMVLDMRLVIFTIVLFLAAPRQSLRWHQYKLKLLYCIFLGFGLATLANFYAKVAGINLVVEDEFLKSMGRVAEFAGFCSHPMWTSAAAALSTLFFVSMAFRPTVRSKLVRYGCFGMVLVSLYVGMISASRSAFFLSLACSLLIIKMQSGQMTKLVRNLLLVGVVAIFFAPFLKENSGAMLGKKNALEVTVQNTSRDELWAQRMAEFRSSPVIGIGFAAHGVGNEKVVGRNESGGSFTAVLAQAGVLGFAFILWIWGTAFMMPRRAGRNPNFILFYASFVFMSIHSILEGYMFQAGWYLCLVIWFVVGVMIEHKNMRRKYPALMV